MLRQGGLIAAALVALVAILRSRQSSPAPPPIVGRKNTVLFITDSANGLSNVHLATSFALSEHHPSIQVHYASFPKLAPDVARISAASSAKNPAAGPIIWHQLPGPDLLTTFDRIWGNVTGIVTPPGLRGLGKLTRDVQSLLAPWGADEHWRLYQAISEIITDIDPAVVVLDSIFRPAVEATRGLNRKHMILSPNTLTDSLSHKQPHGAMFWKYPPIGSGHPFPVPWSLIPSNIYIQARLIYAALVAPDVAIKRKFLAAKGIKKPLDLTAVHQPDAPWLSMSFPEASLPMAIQPEGTFHCGPIVLETAPVEEQDADLAAWLKRAPTMLVNLGSGFLYDEDRAQVMVESFVPVLENTNTQILWKMKRLSPYNDRFLRPVQKYIASGRFRLESWLKADPTSLLATGDIAVMVHHGGANGYHEAILAGVPQVILPLWFDLYNYAATAEYRGIGIWPGKDTAPDWDAQTLSQGFLEALVGEKSDKLKKEAKALSQIARQYEGRDMAARVIAQIAEKGHS